MSDTTSNRREVAAFFSADAPCEVLLEQYQRAYEIRCDELEVVQEQLEAAHEALRYVRPWLLMEAEHEPLNWSGASAWGLVEVIDAALESSPAPGPAAP